MRFKKEKDADGNFTGNLIGSFGLVIEKIYDSFHLKHDDDYLLSGKLKECRAAAERLTDPEAMIRAYKAISGYGSNLEHTGERAANGWNGYTEVITRDHGRSEATKGRTLQWAAGAMLYPRKAAQIKKQNDDLNARLTVALKDVN